MSTLTATKYRPGYALRNAGGRGTESAPALLATTPTDRGMVPVIFLDTGEERTTFPAYVSTAEESARIQSARSDWPAERAAATAARLHKVAVLIENSYADGHESRRVVEVDPPAGALVDWWEDVIFPETGDGHGGDASHDATVLYAPEAHARLVGETYDWQG